VRTAFFCLLVVFLGDGDGDGFAHGALGHPARGSVLNLQQAADNGVADWYANARLVSKSTAITVHARYKALTRPVQHVLVRNSQGSRPSQACCARVGLGDDGRVKRD
jgi:hypothetical protein